MKKKLCMALSAMLLAGATPVFGAETYEQNTLFTATVGTKDFLKNGVFQPLDVEIYIKDGYVMLPLRAFLTAVDEDATMVWHPFGAAQVSINGHNAVFALEDNLIHVDGKRIEVSGEMEVKDGRLFVPLRNWGQILQLCGYNVTENDIFWDKVSRTATVAMTETKAIEGAEAEFSMPLTDEYDELEAIGDGYFLATKYVGEEDVGLWLKIGGPDNVYFVLNSEGAELAKFEGSTIRNLTDLGEGYLLVRNFDEAGDYVMDRTGKKLFAVPYRNIEPFSEGMAKVEDGWAENSRVGYVDEKGELAVPVVYYEGQNFSEGLAAVCVRDEGVWTDGNYTHYIEWGYIDKTGKLVIDAVYQTAGDFFEGLARVRTAEGVSYINKEGKEVIPCQYKWGGYFKDGKTYVTDYDGNTWLIDKTGKKLKLIAEGSYAVYVDDSLDHDDSLKNGVLVQEEIVDLPDGDHRHKRTYFDETGQLTYEEYLIKRKISEGLSPYRHSNLRKYGYVDENGVWVIRPMFGQAEPFKDGYAIVANEIYLENGMRDVEWGIIKHPNP